MITTYIINYYIFFIALIIFTLGLFTILATTKYWFKIIGLTITQNAVLIFYIALAKVKDGIPPIQQNTEIVYSSPLPQVLMLTAIVVGFATFAVGIMLIISK